MQIPESIISFITADALSTLLLIAFLLAARVIFIRMLERGADTLSETRRRWISIIQNSSVILVGLGLVFIWSPELSTFALSLTAFAVALVIATKEFLLCMVGAVYRTVARPFEVGDWIELGDMRGEVVAEGILTTRLQELGDDDRRYLYTGRVLTIPNSLLLANTVTNESFRKRFVHHSFAITFEANSNVAGIKQEIIDVIAVKSAAYDSIAARYWEMVRRKVRTDLPSRDPSVSVGTNHLANIIFHVTFFCPTNEALAVEEAVIDAALSLSYKALPALVQG